MAVASRCSTALVEPPVAITPEMAFSKLRRVTRERGVLPLRTSSMTSLPLSKATSSFRASMAGMPFQPMGDMPSIS